MVLMAVSGAAVLALVCWAALRETAPANESFIPQHGPAGQIGSEADRRVPGDGERQRAGGWGSEGDGERQRAGGWGSEGDGERAGEWEMWAPHNSFNGAGPPRTGALSDATIADADTNEALAAAAALWRVLVRRGS
jgi:hypothetical protein